MKFFFTSILLLILSISAFAQKIGYVDSQYVLENMPEYQSIQKEMDQLSEQWQKELDAMYEKIEKSYDDYRAKEVLLSKDDKEKTQKAIMEDERKAKELQKKRFGYNGELFKLRDEKMKPVQDRLVSTIEQVAKEKTLNVVLDKSGSTTFLYSDAKYDFTNDVMKKLGITAPKKESESSTGGSGGTGGTGTKPGSTSTKPTPSTGPKK